MSWGDARQLTAAAGSRWITNPKQLNKMSIANTNIQLKPAQGTTANSSAGAFFTAIANRGAQTSISVANTYVTVASLSGAGFLFNLISPTHTAAFTPTMRVTVDGVAYVIAPSAAQAASDRMLLGPFTSGLFTATGDSSYANSASDSGFVNAPTGGLNRLTGLGVAALPTPEMALSLNMQCLRFESSLVIEMKCDLLSANAVDKQCGATYTLDL